MGSGKVGVMWAYWVIDRGDVTYACGLCLWYFMANLAANSCSDLRAGGFCEIAAMSDSGGTRVCVAAMDSPALTVSAPRLICEGGTKHGRSDRLLSETKTDNSSRVSEDLAFMTRKQQKRRRRPQD